MQSLKIFIIICIATFGYSLLQAEENRGIRRVVIKNKAGQKVGLYKESHALVIGVSEYNNGWPKLPGVQKDVQVVTTSLRNNGFHVETVIDPNSRELTQAFKLFISRYGRKTENRLLFYFAGHGHTIKPKWGGQPMGYIVPKEAPNPNMEESKFKDIAMPMQRIEEYALSIDSKHALFLFDSCFSGSLFAITRAIPENISYKTAKPVRQFITAGNANETVPDISIFRQQFVLALKGEGDVNKDGFVTGTELGEFLQGKVVNYSKGAQHPQYGKIRNPHLDKGDFVFRIIQKINHINIMPDRPSNSRFSLEDLNKQATKEESIKLAWKEKLKEMKSAFEQIQSYEKRDISPSLKTKAWKRFHSSFLKDNPFSNEDNEMLQKAQKQNSYWQSFTLSSNKVEKGVYVKENLKDLVKYSYDNVGKWLNEFNINPKNAEPPQFRHYFIVITHTQSYHPKVLYCKVINGITVKVLDSKLYMDIQIEKKILILMNTTIWLV